MKTNLQIMILISAVAAAMSSCTPKKKTPASQVLSMNVSGRQVKSELSNPAALMAFMKQNGYYSTAIAAPGVRLFYSTSYETDQKSASSAEAGQANGVLQQGQGGLFFSQAENVTTQALVPPGAGSRFGDGMSRWKFDGKDGYAQLLLDVATNQRARRPGGLHTGYQQMEVALVSFSGGTAGGQVQYSDTLEVSLTGGQSKTEMYFAKGLGGVAVEFREDYMPAGTMKVYLQGTAPSGGGQGVGL